LSFLFCARARCLRLPSIFAYLGELATKLIF
jgi:hypothetical protein